MQSRSQVFQFGLLVLALCSIYLAFEIFFNFYATIGVDEFWFAHNVYAFQHQMPYRDFAPYKTVLGYYILLIPMMLYHASTTATIILTKNLFAILNTGIFFGIALWLRKYFSAKSILASLTVIITSQVVLTYSTNFRVDLLGYWLGFLAFILLIDNRYALAGLFMGLGFAATQKVIWYVAASDGALFLYWLLFEKDLQSLKNLAKYNLSLLASIGAYLALWSSIADWHTVINSVFYEASIMYRLDWYASARLLFWQFLTLNNPPLFFLWPLSFVSVLVTYEGDKAYKQRFFIIISSLIVFACLVPYKQIFPYYLQVAIPGLFLLYTAFFCWLFGIYNHADSLKFLINRKLILLYLGADIVGLLSFIAIFALPSAYLLSCVVPMLLGLYLLTCHDSPLTTRQLIFNIITVVIIMVNGVFPLLLFCIKMVDINGSYQKQNLVIMNQLLQDQSDYIAGIEYIYNKTQPIAGMRHLMGPAIDFLYNPTPKLREVMLPSLNLDPDVTMDTVIAALQNSNVKLYVNNYRMNALPPRIKSYLNSQYEHYWGSIYLYAPEISEGKNNIHIKFSGNYKINSLTFQNIILNDKLYKVNSVIYLTAGEYISQSHSAYRLQLIPDDIKLPSLQQSDQWEKMLS